MAEWYYALEGNRQGPFEDAAFRQMVRRGEVPPHGLVWNEAMPDWLPASEVPGLLTAAPMGIPAVGRSVAVQPAIPLTYATPPNPGFQAMSPGIWSIPKLAEDSGPFLKVAGSFRGPRGNWTGPVFASPMAFYLLKVTRQQQSHVGGLIGILIAAAAGKTDDIRTCKVSELSPIVAVQLDPKGKRKDFDVIVLPMAAARSLQYGKISSILHVSVGPDKFGLVTSIFGKAKRRQFLTDNGWSLNQDLIPTIGQIHGDGLNRPFGEKPRRAMSPIIKMAMIVFGVIVIMVIIAAFASKK